MSPPHLILLNPHAGSAASAAPLRDWAEARGHRLIETHDAAQARRLAREGAGAGQAVLAAGGDGTIHAVVNGLLESGAARPVLGVLPLGTGNDLARSLGLPATLPEVLEVCDGGYLHPVDAFQATIGSRVRYGANVTSVGLGGQLAQAVTSDLKQRWGPLAYVLAGVGELSEVSSFPLSLRVDGRTLEREALGLLVANGRYAAGGFDVAPHARVDDGLLDVIVVQPEGLLDLAVVAALLLTGDYTSSPAVLSLRARRVEVTPPAGFGFNVDGELEGEGTCTIEVLPAALRVFASTPRSPERAD